MACRRSPTLFLYLIVLWVSGVEPQATSARVQNSFGQPPAVGDWKWCSELPTASQFGCIEMLTLESPGKKSTAYSYGAANELPKGTTVKVRCQSRDSVGCYPFEAPISNCVQPGITSAIDDFITVEVSSSGDTWGHNYELTLRTGTFRPGLTLGRGFTGTRQSSNLSQIVSDSSKGTSSFKWTYSYSLTGVLGLESYWVEQPKGLDSRTQNPLSTEYFNWLKTAEATGGGPVGPSVLIYEWGTYTSYLTPDLCLEDPFEGSWAESNGMGFSFSTSGGWGKPSAKTLKQLIGQNWPSPKLDFTAFGPHYKPRRGSEPLEVIGARIQVFLGSKFLVGTGYKNLSGDWLRDFDNSSYEVTTKDDQIARPSVTKMSEGVLIDLGIEHYSAPNPTVDIVVPEQFKLKRNQSGPLSRFVSHSGPGTRNWSVTGGCAISGKNLRTPRRPARCLLSLAVYSKNGKLASLKSARIAVP